MAHLGMGNTKHFHNMFEGSETEPGMVAVSFYTGIYSYAGWNYLNFMTEELKDPFKNLPRAIYTSLPLVTVVYVLANVAYLAVLSKSEMMASDAIAVTFGNRVLGPFAWVMPLFVALSAFGGLSVHIMTSSRLCFVGARQGLFPDFLALISCNSCTPATSLIFLGMLSLVYLCTTDIYTLIEYASFIESMFILLSISALLYMRWKRPDLERPIKVNIIIPILFLIICGFLVLLPVYVRPYEVGAGIAITLTGVPVYCLTVLWKNKPHCFRSANRGFTELMQKLTISLQEEKVE